MKTHNKKLAQYTSLAVSFLSIHNIDAQAIYTDIDPDIVLDSAWEMQA